MTEQALEQTREELRSLLFETIKRLDESAAERPPRLLTDTQAAKYLGVSRGTLEIWRARNYGPRCLELDGRGDGERKMIRYDIYDLDKWASEHPRKKEREA